jgi:NO-binding membrane sensor protein with MHYT domain
MKRVVALGFCFFLLWFAGHAQQDTTAARGLLDELLLMEEPVPANLLPVKIIPTQKLLWGEKGVMRSFNAFELTPENRERELKIRRTMLASHQVLGFVTLGGMVAQGVVGSKLYDGNYDLLKAHNQLATAINITYFTTAGLSMFTPPKMLDERQGISSIKIHKALAAIHFTGMIATNILAQSLDKNPDLKSLHRAAAYTTFGAYAASMIVIKF